MGTTGLVDVIDGKVVEGVLNKGDVVEGVVTGTTTGALVAVLVTAGEATTGFLEWFTVGNAGPMAEGIIATGTVAVSGTTPIPLPLPLSLLSVSGSAPASAAPTVPGVDASGIPIFPTLPSNAELGSLLIW